MVTQFRNFWKNVYRIIAEENTDFDHDREKIVNAVLQQRENEIIPIETPDVNRLGERLLTQIREQGILQALKNFKHQAPGSSGITRANLLHAPHKIIRELTI